MHMQVPVDDGLSSEPHVPVGRALGTAPLREFLVFQDSCGFTSQRKVVDQHCTGSRP